ncbi:hypothetical protein K7W42_07595 [Deinococcus sp. HMF7604]|uniref:hypothetical protein n=1 Tax=Deinococcus betulae TaxID=2873312 RepID=UPI001CCA6EAE|nr:hypothetical protein [Deinococcus betulae]MBZ9750722.1 hypothetical protein [Deinococcus betulae]
MTIFAAEVEANFLAFDATWFNDLPISFGALSAQSPIYLESYKRITSLQGWQTVLESKISSGSFAYFVEAHNDALMSHVLARVGSWRLALKSLRSLMENTLKCLYYKDHPVELELSHIDKHKIGFSEMMVYFEAHPLIRGIDDSLVGIPTIKSEYATLSKAVHGSAISFRMTGAAAIPQFWKPDVADLGRWSTRERLTIHSLNLIMISLMKDEINGAKAVNARKAISLGAPAAKFADIKVKHGVSLRV